MSGSNTIQTLAIDAMGGDYGPEVTIPASANFLKKHPDTKFLFFGDEKKIRHELEKHAHLLPFSQITHTDKIISNDDKPSTALRKSKDTSMRLAIEAVKNGDANACVSAGNTGALMALAKLVLRPLEGIHRPAIASLVPAPNDDTIMMDMGANLLVDSENLVQFAILGSLFAKAHKDIKTPTIGLLNVGSEGGKGPDHVKEAAEQLKTLPLPGHYHGYVEGNEILTGTVDVIITDGYAGNIALKTMEGTAKTIGRMLKQTFTSDPLAILGTLLSFFALRRFKQKTDPRLYNGGVFLGLNGLCVKSHGGADAIGFQSAINLAHELALAGYINQVQDEVTKLNQNIADIQE